MNRVLAGLLLAAVMLLAAACGSDTPTDSAVAPTPASTPQETAQPTPTPAKTNATAKPVSWTGVALLSEVNYNGYNSAFSTPLLFAETGKLKVEWDVDSTEDEYNWNIVVFREGQTPDNSTSVGPMLSSDATFDTGTPDKGSKAFKVKSGEQYYVRMEIVRCRASVILSEAR